MRGDQIARRYLFGGNKTKLSHDTGIPYRTLYTRAQRPGRITLDELAGLVKANELDKEELWKVVMTR